MVEQVTLSGVVLSAMPISEYDKRLVLLTKERGKITAFARGARKPNSPFLSGSQPMSFGEFTVYQGRNAYTVTGIKVTKYFAQDMTDIDKMSYSMYFLELADYYGREGLEASDMLNLLYLSIRALTENKIPDRLIRVIYELKTMVLNGEYPNVFSCVKCGGKDEVVAFDRRGNGVVCKECQRRNYLQNCDRNDYSQVSNHHNYQSVSTHFVPLDNSSLYALQFITTASLTKLYSFTVAEQVLEKLEQIVTPYLNKIVDKEFKSLEFLENMY